MAYATARATFSFHQSIFHPATNLTKPIRTHLPISLPNPKRSQISPVLLSSVSVSKEDKPVAERDPPESAPPIIPTEDNVPTAAAAAATASVEEEVAEKNIDKRRLEERFAVLNTGVYECRSCGYRFDEAVGDPSYPIPPGLTFGKLPEDWRCPTCGAAKSFFESKSVEIAGFAQNQEFGLGGNTLTSGQKSSLIYGSLLLAFIFFLSGYFLQ